MICPAAVDDDAIRAAMARKCFSKKPLCSCQITVFAEEELIRVTNTVDGTVKIHPSAAYLDAGLVKVPPASDGALALVETLHELGREVNDPAVHSRMSDTQAAFSHHLFEITQVEIVSEVPAYAQQDHRSVEMAAFEHGEFPETQSHLCMIDIAISFATEPKNISYTVDFRMNLDAYPFRRDPQTVCVYLMIYMA